MGGTSFDIGLVVEGGVKHYDFNPVIERWLVTVPMIHLVTLGAGGGSICRYDRLHGTVQVGPSSAGSDPGPACYDRGGLYPTVTDADLALGYLSPDRYAGGNIKLNPTRAQTAIEDNLCEEIDCSMVEAARMIKRRVDANMANGIFQELRARGYDPRTFTMLAYGGNGPLHACGIANILGINRILVPPFCSVFSAVGAGNMHQLHIHERSLFMYIYDSTARRLLSDYQRFNLIVEDLETAGRLDLLRQGMRSEDIKHRLDLDKQFSVDYGNRFGKGSEAPEAGIRINTVRVSSYVELETVQFSDIAPRGRSGATPAPLEKRQCFFVEVKDPVETAFYDISQLEAGHVIDRPSVIISPVTTYLVEPGWQLEIADHGAAWFTRLGVVAGPVASSANKARTLATV
jgi:N-methylhydantoinase A